jgi:hypothetical protein
LTNSVTGTITVDGAYGGVTGDGVCTNSGIINISNVTLGVGMAMINNASVSIRNCSTGLSTNDFVNNASASLAIAQASINGISMPSGSFDNHGIITIDTCATGMTLYDVQNTFNNTGFLTVRKTVGYGIYSWGAPSKITKFHNTSSGIINVLFAGSVGVSLDGPVTNEGEMNVFDSFFAGILFADKVLNSGTINTARSGQFGLKFSSSIVPDTLHNSASGQIFLVDDAEGFSCSNGLVLNDGLIDISGTASDGLEINKTEFQNSGQLLIDDIGNQGVLIYSSIGAHFNNKLGGTVGISNVGLNGIDCQKKLTNKGSIAIANSAVNGIYNHSTHDTLRNEGSITIINSGDYGLQNRAAADTTLLWNTSTGSILIDNGGDYGLLNYRTNFFNDGLVEIQNSDDGLYFTGGQLSGAPPFEVRNFGKIKVSNSTGDGIVSSGEFSNKSGGIIDVSFSDGYDLNGLSLHNEACGKIKLDGRIYISPGRELLNDVFLVLGFK